MGIASYLRCLVTEEDQTILKKAYHNPLRKKMIRYGIFWEDIKKMLPRLPSHIGSAPISYIKTLGVDVNDPDPAPPTSKGGKKLLGVRTTYLQKVRN